MVFRGRLAFWRTAGRRKTTRFAGGLTPIGADGAPRRVSGYTGHLVLRGFLNGIHHSQVRLELRKTFGDKNKNIANALERELHLEAIIRIEEEYQTPRIAAIRRDETEILKYSVNRLVQMERIPEQ